MIKKVSITTRSRAELVDVTSRVVNIVKESKVKSGTCHIFVPHTTAGILINENADPSVKSDILKGLERMAPLSGDYKHAEGNADAHIKSTVIGIDKTIPICEGDLGLGTWQGIFFCEFDGPRQREMFVTITEN